MYCYYFIILVFFFFFTKRLYSRPLLPQPFSVDDCRAVEIHQLASESLLRGAKKKKNRFRWRQTNTVLPDCVCHANNALTGEKKILRRNRYDFHTHNKHISASSSQVVPRSPSGINSEFFIKCKNIVLTVFFILKKKK